ncbi:TPA: hypothetical protein I7108_003976 [Vibrio cholerae O1]|uniref:hypothetical protein n=1 Tax=Vibrio cholerae TaxID=666 RepID=UPI00034A2F38|nr:hypothetical protein [Vibrio cholerae]HAS2380083.1 hypothetical protein [Vibrio cholerae O1]EGR4075057.1 hypothetical protein [Vibrio cholerae]EGR4107137.1 hypothetical protein [Vibrio cholerae]EGR4332692.1 hypothetical protein [Vibrio cholerae]EGR4478246.1 hypothetical protein [Vibrio cholerae]
MKIGDIEIGELKPAPELESGDEKEVFAFYGLASFKAQCAEKALVNFVMGYQLVDASALTEEQWLELYERLNSHTFGRLLGHIKKRVELPDALVAHLDLALQKRNWLAHDFFNDYAVHMTEPTGRIQMVTELQSLITMFQIADRAVEKLSSAVWREFGIDDVWIENEMAIQLSEYQSAKNA